MEKLFSNWEETRKKIIAEHKEAWERLNKEKAKYKTREEWKVAQLNKQKGNLNKFDGFNCEKCNNRGGSFYLDENNNEVFKRCECQKRRQMNENLKKSGFSQSTNGKTLETFVQNKTWQKNLVRRAREFIQEKNVFWFYVGGQCGCGKTHICTAISIKLLEQNKNVYYMPWRDEVTRLKSVIYNEQKYRSLINRLKEVEVLYIDDFFKTGKNLDGKLQMPAPQEVNIAYEIINTRYANKKITIFSGERSIEDLDKIDEAISSRISEMCNNSSYCIFVKSDPDSNFRKINQKRCTFLE